MVYKYKHTCSFPLIHFVVPQHGDVIVLSDPLTYNAPPQLFLSN